MTDSLSQPGPPRHNKLLVLIAAFKLGQALLFAAVGFGALRLLHKDVGAVLTQLAEHVRFNQESRFVKFFLEQASLLDIRLLRRIVEGFFIYAALDLVEGTGLYLEKVWAEYLTLAITASFLPLEIYELFRRITPIRVGLLAANALVFIYLLKLVMARHRMKREPPADGGGKFAIYSPYALRKDSARSKLFLGTMPVNLHY